MQRVMKRQDDVELYVLQCMIHASEPNQSIQFTYTVLHIGSLCMHTCEVHDVCVP